MCSKDELACIYAAAALIDDDIAVTSEKIQTMLKAANVEVEPYWPGLFAKALESINPMDLISNIGSGVRAAGPAAAGGAVIGDAAAAPVAETKAEEKKVEEEDESDDDMGFGLFD